MATDDSRKESPPRGYQSDGGLVPVPDPTSLTTQLVDRATTALRQELEFRFQSIIESARLVREDYTRVPTQVDRAASNLRELLEAKIGENTREFVHIREQFDHIHDVTNEHFALIEVKFTELEKRRDDSQIATDKAIATALDAQREGVTARMAVLKEQIDRLKSVFEEVFQRIDVQFVERDKRTEQLALASSTAIAAALQAAKEAVGAQNTSNSIAIAKSESSTLESLRQLRDLFQADSKAMNDKIDDLKTRVTKNEGSQSGGKEIWGYMFALLGLLIAIGAIVATTLTHH